MDGNAAGTSLQATGQSPPGIPDSPGTLSIPKFFLQAQAAGPLCRAKHPGWGQELGPTGPGLGAGRPNRILAALVSRLQAGTPALRPALRSDRVTAETKPIHSSPGSTA